MEMKTTSLIVLAVVLSIIASVLLQISDVGRQHFSQINSYADCVAAGNPILESYPSQCKTTDGRTFVNPNEHVSVPQQMQQQDGQSQQYVATGCAVAGCSGEICTDAASAADIASSCVYAPEFACYKTARCETQSDGKCGWTQTSDLSACIAAAPKAAVQPISN